MSEGDSVFRAVVESLLLETEESIRVQFVGRAALYAVDKAHPDYRRMVARLKRSRDEQRPVEVHFLIAGQRIVKVA